MLKIISFILAVIVISLIIIIVHNMFCKKEGFSRYHRVMARSSGPKPDAVTYTDPRRSSILANNNYYRDVIGTKTEPTSVIDSLNQQLSRVKISNELPTSRVEDVHSSSALTSSLSNEEIQTQSSYDNTPATDDTNMSIDTNNEPVSMAGKSIGNETLDEAVAEGFCQSRRGLTAKAFEVCPINPGITEKIDESIPMNKDSSTEPFRATPSMLAYASKVGL